LTTGQSERPFTGRDALAFNFQHILYEKREGRATITINRPEVLNAVNYGVLHEMNTAFKDASWDDAVGWSF
jgi:1,4-dihydroxy-2-naphthoyl-CoA synthase